MPGVHQAAQYEAARGGRNVASFKAWLLPASLDRVRRMLKVTEGGNVEISGRDSNDRFPLELSGAPPFSECGASSHETHR